MTRKVLLLLPGDGIGPEVVAQAERVLLAVDATQGSGLQLLRGRVGGAALDVDGCPLPMQTLEAVRGCDAVLLGAVGGPAWADVPRELRPEQGLLALRRELGLYINLRPAFLYPELVECSPLRDAAGLDLVLVRELAGGLYYGEPRGIRTVAGGREGYNTLRYHEREIERVAEYAFALARQRRGRLCSVDKANVLETMELWREVCGRVGLRYPDVALEHLYVDNAAMQMVLDPRRFDVMLADNLFGDVLSDLAGALCGSIGLLPSASLGGQAGLYEPVHGSAPDIAGQDRANPLACILSAALLLRHSLGNETLALQVEAAVQGVLRDGLLPVELGGNLGTAAMGDAVLERLCAG